MDGDQPGVSDFVLLSDISDESIVENLRVRFEKDVVYTFIGTVVVALNPYKQLPIYTPEWVARYRGSNIYEHPPHIYSIAETAHRNLLAHARDQCVLITGESGAGKTEASKIFLGYVAGFGQGAVVRERLVGASPCLEAFGNAKTAKNDNSSRFGKYMDLEFDFRGTPVGGKITTYLLEKSRVVNHSANERSFHIFYQLLAGGDDTLLTSLSLTRDPEAYAYLRGDDDSDSPRDNAIEYSNVMTALRHVGVDDTVITDWVGIVAAVLHLGNIQFEQIVLKEGEEVGEGAGGKESAVVVDGESVDVVARLLGVTTENLKNVLVRRSVYDPAKKEKITVPLQPAQAAKTRDALAKTLYGRLFTKVVETLNKCINADSNGDGFNVIGVLDIYGFEVMEHNGFDQFLINYCNEKLQQLFIELTLKSEQDDYEKEGIEWTEITYFNNQTICELIEAKPLGIIALLDEESSFAGTPTAATLLTKLDQNVSKHAHYESRSKQSKGKSNANLLPSSGSGDNLKKSSAISASNLSGSSSSTNLLGANNRRMLAHNEFMLKHYAGDVVYETDGFLDRNVDSLWRDVTVCLSESSRPIVQTMFLDPQNEEAEGRAKRPDTLATQFKSSMAGLIQNLTSKMPHYIRCIKPNGVKENGHFDADLVGHQCRYLGLRENILVRRAGFCYRSTFPKFLARYKMLGPDRSTSPIGTWPNYISGNARDGLLLVLQEAGISDSEFRLGKTKVFIRHPDTVLKLETLRNECKEALATLLKAVWRGKRVRRDFEEKRRGIVKIQACIRRRLGVRHFQNTRSATLKLQTQVRGWIARRQYKSLRRTLPKYAVLPIQCAWRRTAGRKWLQDVGAAARTSGPAWRTAKWPTPLPGRRGRDLEAIVVGWYNRIMAKRYRDALPTARKAYIEWKAVASDNFHRKASYPAAFASVFTPDHIGLNDPVMQMKWASVSSEPVLSAVSGFKLHRRNPAKSVPRLLVLTPAQIYLLDPKTFVVKARIAVGQIVGVSTSTAVDGIMIIHCPGAEKGDVLLRCDQYGVEFLSRVVRACGEGGKVIRVVVDARLSANCRDGSSPVLTFSPSDQAAQLNIKKNKDVWNVVVPPASNGTVAPRG